jgi:hypothetical protein
MWWYLQCIGLVLALFAPALPACAQGDMTIQFRPVNVHNLAGVVTGASGKGFQGAVVEDCDSTYKRVLASTTTDANGRFSFAHAKYGTVHYLNVRYPNFQLIHIPATLRFFARGGLRIHLIPGT